MLRTFQRTTFCVSFRCVATFVDPFGAKDPRRLEFDPEDVLENNKPTGFYKRIGDPEKGLADDTSVHPFGDLRINLARFNPNNLCFWWEYDFTGGRILNNGQNALLSNETKNKIYELHKNAPEEWTIERLAETYKIRRQRVLAILTLKERAEKEMSVPESTRETYKGIQPPQFVFQNGGEEEIKLDEEETESTMDKEKTVETDREAKEDKKILDEDWYRICDWTERHIFNATATEGSGERHFVSVPTFPKFEEIPLSEAEKYRETEWSISRVNRLYTIKEDKYQQREFRERLLMNTGKIGTTLDFVTDRTKMHRSPPKHPTPIVVTSIDEDILRPYVAMPDGTQRRLTDDEFLVWKRTNREAFTKLVRMKIENEKKREAKTDA